ncbi:Ig-like domain-containing protein [Aeromonas caviae]|uniref:Ig-like domain-containing protein n=1 Tax=Aeromonas caviae TaxID=648 RepID=A0AA42R926_AERCA|nr:Ig-like domain-containing protein [Aeromonas caviae]MDH0436510.1 Ig-like domain-containing protein [Aeromonas caviae]MDH0477450.1 Ig-like domain-containing protein [Aeromonas caviae]MDH0939162.1 Ig-like domain-containing protein [Aeromonas caviae]MDH1399986.1 Ig-like domain-containing protein [Aeromonas caviae]MDH1505891.1 Ig-like domain-containing protein [Aeromonas caviae]
MTKIAALVMISLAAPVSAQVYELSFTDTNSEAVVKKPDLTWYNPNGTIIVTAISGLDRKVKVELLKGGSVVQTQTSGVITVANRISASDGNEFYGVKFNLTKPEDGNHILRTTVYDINNVQVSVNEYPLNVDTVPPTGNPISTTATGYGRVTTGAEWLLGRGGSESPDITISVQDEASGIASGKFVIYRGDDSACCQRNLALVQATNSFNVPLKSIFPTSNLDELFKLEFQIKDKAGNIFYSPRQNARWDNVVNAPGVFGVYNPNSSNTLGPGLSKFDAYTPGMAVFTNPIRLAYRLPKSNYAPLVQSGVNISNAVGEVAKVGEDDTYVYLTMTIPFGMKNENYVKWTNFGTWSGGPIDYNLTLGEGVSESPVLRKVEYLYSDIGWGSWVRMIDNSALPISISQIRYTVDPRPYPQRVEHYANCTVPANETTCTANWSTTLAKGTTGYIHGGLNVFDDTRVLRSQPAWAEVNWNDQHYPSIAQTYNATTKLLTLNINQPANGSYFDRLRLKEVWLESGGVKVGIAGKKTGELGPDYTYQFDLTKLPQGDYNLVAVAQENHGPKSTLDLFPIYSDKTKPTLQVKYQNAVVPTEIETIKNLRVLLTDNYDTAPVITRMTLSGGPINDALDLGFSKLADGWQPEVPRMFPTLDAGQKYTLNVTASDAQGNIATVTQVFSLSPQNLVHHDGITVLATSQSLLDSNDKPLGKISFKGALTDGGSQSRGPQAGYFTLSRDSAFAVMFNGSKVAPGETKDVVIPLDATGSVTLPVWPADTGVKGKASYMLDIPQLTAN